MISSQEMTETNKKTELLLKQAQQLLSLLETDQNELGTLLENKNANVGEQIKGNALYCYVSLKAGEDYSDDLKEELKQTVRKKIGPIATPDLIHFTAGLPKTRSGKIMRRILRKIAANQHNELGDTTTLADPGVVDELVKNRLNK